MSFTTFRRARGRMARGLVAISITAAISAATLPLDAGVAQAALLPAGCVTMSAPGATAVVCGELQVAPVGGAEDAVFGCQVIAAGAIASTGIGCLLENTATGVWYACACNLFLPGLLSVEAGDATGLPPATYALVTCWYYTPILNVPHTTLGGGCATLPNI